MSALKHRIAVEIEGQAYDLAVTCTETEAHDIGQAIANSSTVEQVDVYRVRGPLLFSWGEG